ncbi:MAG: peptidoglycan DD-metalloendopeptidase family protein [Alphaproteobacteria bacterium]|nr:peptidoglycan DD-metalloendopeptidase family protein [Alphaproteobacteria bacterium]
MITISSRTQVVSLCLILCIGIWSFYSYHLYNKTGNILYNKDAELVKTRDAYLDLMTNFVILHDKIENVLADPKTAAAQKKSDIENYKRQAAVLEEKIKQIQAENNWIDEAVVSEKVTINEALLQRDIAISERDELKKKVAALENTVEDIRGAETEVLEQVKKIAAKEVDKIKKAFSSINVPLKQKGLYFNALANRKEGKGGLYVPEKSKIKDKEISKRVSAIYDSVQDLEYYREVVKSVPIGKPVWSYWLTSPFGSRSDPFQNKRASHKGVDLASRTGNKISVQAKGKVTYAGWMKGYGYMVEVNHGNGFKTKYGHMNKIYVKKGDEVKFNTALGEVGSTGRSTGPHLHYEILYNGVPVDPMPFIKAKI